MPTGEPSTGGSQIPPWIIRGSASPWEERLHLFYCRVINKELVKYLLLLRKSSQGSSRLRRRWGWKETEGPLGLTCSPHPRHGVSGQPSPIPSWLDYPRGLKSPEVSSHPWGAADEAVLQSSPALSHHQAGGVASPSKHYFGPYIHITFLAGEGGIHGQPEVPPLR